MPNLIVDGEGDVYLTPYKSYVALMSQVFTGNPTAIVLNGNDSNYLGDIVWTRTGVGFYIGTLAGAFNQEKVFLISNCYWNGTISFGINESPDSVYLETLDGGVDADGKLLQSSIEIRVYP